MVGLSHLISRELIIGKIISEQVKTKAHPFCGTLNGTVETIFLHKMYVKTFRYKNKQIP